MSSKRSSPLVVIAITIGLAACTGPTTFDDVAPVLARSCTHCHKPGGIAPFALETYGEVMEQTLAIKDAITTHVMPPWDAVHDEDCQNPIPFANNESLSDDEIKTITDWIDRGAPAGSPSTKAISKEVSTLDNPDMVVAMPAPYQPQLGDDFRCFAIDPQLANDVYVTAVDFEPGNRSIVHHSSLVVDPTRANAAHLTDPTGYGCNDLAGAVSELYAWTPGMGAYVYPPEVGQGIPAGSLLVIIVHYAHGTADETPDLSEFKLSTTTVPPVHALGDTEFGDVLATDPSGPHLLPGPDDRGGPEFFIPLGSTGHTETMDIPLGWGPAKLYAIQAHAHFAGTEIRADLYKADGTSVCLLKDRWNFFWQRRYVYDAEVSKLLDIGPGDTVEVKCTYDNSPDNTGLVDYHDQRQVPLDDINFGYTSLDEMCHVMAVLIAE